MTTYIFIKKQNSLSKELEKVFAQNGGRITAEQFRESITGQDMRSVIISDKRIVSSNYLCYEARGETVYHCGLISFS